MRRLQVDVREVSKRRIVGYEAGHAYGCLRVGVREKIYAECEGIVQHRAQRLV